MSEKSFALHADFVHAPTPERVEEAASSWLVVVDGKVAGLFSELPRIYSGLGRIEMPGRLAAPGFTDLHVHAPQHQFRGLNMDLELIEWLERHTFPEEARYSDLDYAEKAYSIFVSELLRGATTRACVFATVHPEATKLLCRMLEESGLYAYVGKVNMDRNCPDGLREDTGRSVGETLEFISSFNSDSRVKPIITPRFIPSCSDELCGALGEMAEETKVPVQSHMSENRSEIEWVGELCPDASTYGQAYLNRGLIGKSTSIMAHCVWPGDDMDLLADEDVYVAHCPDSNANLSSGVAPVVEMMERGVKVGIGTDVAGGASLSMPGAVAMAVKASKLRTVWEGGRALLFSEAFHLATRGGGAFFGDAGSFEPGMDADIVVLDESGIPTALEGLSPSERLERYCYLAPEAPVLAKWAGGRRLV